MLSDGLHISIDTLQSRLLQEKGIQLKVARMDKLHPIVSGNKLFKLHFFLKEALNRSVPIVTFGGAYSNHLAATAYACRAAGISCRGIVRGERPPILSHTLQTCIANGMELVFLPRSEYGQLASRNLPNIPGIPTDALIIPEGGYHPDGARGAATILDYIPKTAADAIVVAVGTATTVSGLLQNAGATGEIIAVPVLKGFKDLELRVKYLNGTLSATKLSCWDDYHFGGYAKKNAALIGFMNEFYHEHQLPTDFVYTAKMMFAVIDKIKSGYFQPGTRVLCLHTGGLQGNLSLPSGSLIF